MSRPNKSADKIVDALINLMRTRNYADITICDITKAADVSRICFYRNFVSKEQVLDAFVLRVVQEIESGVAAENIHDLNSYFLLLFETIRPYSPVVHEIVSAELGGIIFRHFNEKLFLTLQKKQKLELTEYRRRFYIGASTTF